MLSARILYCALRAVNRSSYCSIWSMRHENAAAVVVVAVWYNYSSLAPEKQPRRRLFDAFDSLSKMIVRHKFKYDEMNIGE